MTQNSSVTNKNDTINLTTSQKNSIFAIANRQYEITYIIDIINADTVGNKHMVAGSRHATCPETAGG